jgi:hypothetical protein
MTDARFQLQLTLRDKMTGETLHTAADLAGDTIRISARDVSEMKLGRDLGVALMPVDQVITIMRQREYRKDLFVMAATQLAKAMAERMEDAEGWHDQSRIEPARQSLGGKWRD